MPKLKTIHGKPVEYPTKSLVVDVSAKHARIGNRKDWTSCAISQACTDIGFVKAAATLSRLYVETKDKVLVYRMPVSARNQLIGFDRFEQAAKFDPGEYIFPPLSPSEKATGQRTGTKTNENKKTKKRTKRHTIFGVRGKFNPLTNW